MNGAGRAGPPVEVVLRPSRQLAAWICLVHAAALGALAATRLPDWAVAALAATVLVSSVHHLRRHATLSASAAVRRLIWTRDGEWLVTDAEGLDSVARLLPGAFVTPWLVVLNLRSGHGARHSVLLTRDNCDAEELRRLRARLRAERD